MAHEWTSQSDQDLRQLVKIVTKISASLDTMLEVWAPPLTPEVSRILAEIIKEDNVAALRVLMQNGTLTPNVEVEGETLLGELCASGARSCVAFLLRSPRLNVNTGSSTAFYASLKHPECARLLLRDPRLCPNKLGDDKHTPLVLSGVLECAESIKAWAASGRPFHVRDKHVAEARAASECCHRFDYDKHRAYEDMAELLEGMHTDPHTTRYNLRLKSGDLQYHAAFTFAVVVFLCDGLFEFVRDIPDKAQGAHRFLSICQKLPLELQMLVCLRSVGSIDTNIEGHQREEAFQFLGYQLEHGIDPDLE